MLCTPSGKAVSNNTQPSKAQYPIVSSLSGSANGLAGCPPVASALYCKLVQSEKAL